MGAPAEAPKVGKILSYNPSSGEVLGEVTDNSPEFVKAAVASARAAQSAWGAMPVRERCKQLGRWRDQIVARAEEICELIAKEGGKTKGEALNMEVMVICDLATYFVKRGPKILAPHKIGLHMMKNRASYVHYQPRGVVGIISPWNFPFGIPVGEVLMALVAGNAVVLKPSEMTPLIALKAKELYDAAGLPPDLFQVVTGRGAAGVALIDSGIDYCIFTGSTATGKKVGAACGERLIPCALELGGKTPAIICDDADLDRTAKALVWGAFSNQGQVCVSVERVYAHTAIYDQLLEKVVAETRALRQGDPTTMVDTGSMTWEDQVRNVEGHIKKATEEGGKVLTGGKRVGQGMQFQPTVIGECRHEMDVMRREIFGPIMPIARVQSEDEAVAHANDSQLGLMAYVFTNDRQKGKRLAERIESGMVMVNECLLTFGMPETPWQGIKQSGIGRTHSDEGLRDLCQARHVNYDRARLKRELWWYPYSENLYGKTLKALRWLFR